MRIHEFQPSTISTMYLARGMPGDSRGRKILERCSFDHILILKRLKST
jgi:hypothetical protein